MNAIAISTTALDVEWQRMEVSARNLANMNSTRDANGDVYRPLRLVSGPEIPFSAMLSAGTSIGPSGVRVIGVEAMSDGFRRVLEPGHPHADAEGFVTYPNVDHAAEMTLMIRASRAYEANLAALSIAQDMYGRALDLGRQS
jgi:flagellar basal-body rod protein FlgC